MQEIFEIVVKTLTEFFKIRQVAIFQLGISGVDLNLAHSFGFGKASTQILRNLKADIGIFKRLIDSKIPQIVNDLPETEKSLASLAGNEKLESMIAVPVFSEERLWGILTVFSQEKFRFREEDGKIITLFGGQVGQLLECYSRHVRDSLDEILVPILGSIELLNFRYRDREIIPASEMLDVQNRFKKRVLSCVAGLEHGSIEQFTGKEKTKEEKIKLPSGGELEIEEVITIKGDENSRPKVKKVLVIDDQPLVTDLLESVLERMDYKCEVAACGKDGLEMFEKDGFDLVITDLGMPDMSGWEVSKAIKQKKPHVPVVIVTGWGVDPDPDKMKDSKADRVINKPFQVDQLEKIIQDLLEK